MKKNLFSILSICALSLVAFASCKKDHTCTCNVALNPLLGGGTGFDTTLIIRYDDMTKKQAKSACKGSEETISQLFGGLVSANCDL